MAAKRDRFLPVLLALIVALALSAQPLPEWLAPFRPDWVAMVMIYWAMHMPRRFTLAAAFSAGLLLDALHGTPIGQHALALVLLCYLPLKLHLRLAVVSVTQTTLWVVVCLALYHFVLFWCNGATGKFVAITFYWGPLIGSAMLWPLLLLSLDNLRRGRTVRR